MASHKNPCSIREAVISAVLHGLCDFALGPFGTAVIQNPLRPSLHSERSEGPLPHGTDGAGEILRFAQDDGGGDQDDGLTRWG